MEDAHPSRSWSMWSWLALVGSVSGVANAQQWLRDRGPGELVALRWVADAALAADGKPRGPVFDNDLSTWPYAWAFWRDSLEPPLEVPPVDAATLHQVTTALVAATRSKDDELATTALWSLARIGRTDAAVATATAAVLQDGWLAANGRRGELASLAAGLIAAHDVHAVASLVRTAGDGKAGERARAFAFYGLGLAAQNSDQPSLQFRTLAALERVFLADSATPEIVTIAALHALALVRIDVAPDLSAPAGRLLEMAWTGSAIDWVRSHVPLAVASVLDPADPSAEAWRTRFVATIEDAECPRAVARACVLALASLCRPFDGLASPDAEYADDLRRIARTADDQQMRNYALLAQGIVGGAEHRAFLVERLGTAPSHERPWITLGIALAASREAMIDGTVVAAMKASLAVVDPQMAGAAAVAVGVIRAAGFDAELATRAQRFARNVAFGTPFAAALAMTDGADALPALRHLAATSSVVEIATEAMRGLVRRGDAESIAAIRAWLADGREPIRRRIAAALALRGRADATITAALVAQVTDESSAAEARHFAAFALGSVGDTSARHWSAELARAIDYREATPVLLGLPNGVLRLP